MARDLLDLRDPSRGIRTVIERDEDTGLLVIKTVQNTRPVLDANAAARFDFDRHIARRIPGGWRRVASLPTVVVMQLNDQGIMRGTTVIDHKRFDKFISDIDHRKLRTDDGKRLA